ncbi:MAG: hypothetical protein FWE48_07525 [Coriobacteriia bacterium]|nr:hypothetical protein [Coriobacteriia bacterium]
MLNATQTLTTEAFWAAVVSDEPKAARILEVYEPHSCSQTSGVRRFETKENEISFTRHLDVYLWLTEKERVPVGYLQNNGHEVYPLSQEDLGEMLHLHMDLNAKRDS